jgi:hypothetical protein
VRTELQSLDTSACPAADDSAGLGEWRNAPPFYAQASDLPGLISAADRATRFSSRFFEHSPTTEFEIRNNVLSFPSPWQSPHPENNTAQALWRPAARRTHCAAIIVPHWGAAPGAYAGLCRVLNWAGISCLEMVTPYHGTRAPEGCSGASWALSANLLRTIATARQATLEIRCCADWLEMQGFKSPGLVGTSLGSSYVVLAAAHDSRFSVNILNHCSGHLPEMVWNAKITRSIRRALEPMLNLDGLRAVWKAINPTSYVRRLSLRPSKTLLIYGWLDAIFPLRYSLRTVETWRELGMDYKAVGLPCGHRALGIAPFKFMDAWHICTFLKENLNER